MTFLRRDGQFQMSGGSFIRSETGDFTDCTCCGDCCTTGQECRWDPASLDFPGAGIVRSTQDLYFRIDRTRVTNSGFTPDFVFDFSINAEDAVFLGSCGGGTWISEIGDYGTLDLDCIHFGAGTSSHTITRVAVTVDHGECDDTSGCGTMNLTFTFDPTTGCPGTIPAGPNNVSYRFRNPCGTLGTARCVDGISATWLQCCQECPGTCSSSDSCYCVNSVSGGIHDSEYILDPGFGSCGCPEALMASFHSWRNSRGELA
jgi:hypothetical protein